MTQKQDSPYPGEQVYESNSTPAGEPGPSSPSWQVMNLAAILGVAPSQVRGDRKTAFTGLACDSRDVRPGDVFFAWPGCVHDGHQFVEQAIARGAVAAVVQNVISCPVPTIVVENTRLALAIAAAHFYNHPSKHLRLTGVTGTNGKTTVTFMLQHILEAAGRPTGMTSSVANMTGGTFTPSQLTTPESLTLTQLLGQMVDHEMLDAVVEVSSQALKLHRVAGCEFDVAVFTNLSRDHLSRSEHDSWSDYRDSKLKLFRQLGTSYYQEPKANQKYAVINADDSESHHFVSAASVPVITYGLSPAVAVTADNLRYTGSKSVFTLRTPCGRRQVTTNLPGRSNVYNALAAAAAAMVLDVDLDSIVKGLAATRVPGRYERVDLGQPFGVTIDYAHNPEALHELLTTVRSLHPRRLITVFGAPGNRDRGKRPLMAEVVSCLSDLTIVTTDDAYDEEPQQIIGDIQQGLLPGSKALTIVDRSCAITYAVTHARPRDMIVIAGRGHETVQRVYGKAVELDDRLVARQAIRKAMAARK